MIQKTTRKADADCPICYAAHDQEIHDATMRLHGWFRRYVTQGFEEEPRYEAPVEEYVEAQVA